MFYKLINQLIMFKLSCNEANQCLLSDTNLYDSILINNIKYFIE